MSTKFKYSSPLALQLYFNGPVLQKSVSGLAAAGSWDGGNTRETGSIFSIFHTVNCPKIKNLILQFNINQSVSYLQYKA